jgi:hypothetical protein
MVTGSYVRLPVDANYIDDWSTGPVYCQGGGTKYFWSPVFQTTVNGKTTNWVFNHLSQSYLGANGRTKGWYNGGALVGLTGGGTCDTGFPTFSSGPHFCNEVRDYDPFTYWQPVGDYTSACTGSNGTSGVANPVCGGMMMADPCASAMNGNGAYCGGGLTGGDPKVLYDCQNGKSAGTTTCQCGCSPMPKGVPDVCAKCGDPCGSAMNGNGGYCGSGLTGGDPNLLYQCANGATASTTLCKCGCSPMPKGIADICATSCAPPDLGTTSADLGSGVATDGGGGGGARDAAADLATGSSDVGGCSTGGRRGGPLFLVGLLALWGLRRRARERARPSQPAQEERREDQISDGAGQ